MTRAAGNPRVGEGAWGADILRLTVFHSPAATVRAEGWWEQVTGQPPDNCTGMPKTGQRVEVGDYEGLKVLLDAEPRKGRIDWLCKSAGQPDDPLSSFVDAAQVFINLMNTFLRRDDLPQTNRIAFGAVVVLSVPDLDQGYRTISDYLDFDLDRRTARDFLYQINRRRRSMVVPDLEINRLSKWSVGTVSRQALMLTDDGLATVADSQDVATGCRLELDINTVPGEQTIIPRDRYEPLLIELFTLAREIMREGDIP